MKPGKNSGSNGKKTRGKNNDYRGSGFYKNGKWENNDYRPKGKGAKVEVDIPRSSVNKADFSNFGLRSGSSGKNDISFWNKFPALFSNATRIQAPSQVGSVLPWDPRPMSNDALNRQLSSSVNNASVPGIMVLRYIPTIGEVQNNRSPINQLLTSSYAWYRSHYRAAARYEPADIGIYYTAISSAAMLWAELTRLVGLVRMYKSRNLYSARSIIQSLGYDCDDLVTNLANLEQFVNTFAAQLRQWPLPKELSLAARWVQLSSNIYKDSDDDTAQLYVWQTNGYYVFEEGASDNPAGRLTYKEWITVRDRINEGDDFGTMTYSDIVSKINRLLDPFFGSSSMAQLASDTSTAIGEANMYDYPDIRPNFVIEPKYEPEEQAQIENATFLGIVTIPRGSGALDITQVIPDPSANTATYLTQHVGFDMAATAEAGVEDYPLFLQTNRVLNVHGKEMSPEDVMINTRMMPVGTVTSELDTPEANYYNVTMTSYGTEIPTTMTIASISEVKGSLYTALITFGSGTSIDLSVINAPGTYLQLSMTSYVMKSILPNAFDWHPTFYTFARGLRYGENERTYYGGSSQYDFIGATVDYDEYTLVDDDQLTELHKVAALSALYIPSVSYYQSR